MKATVLQSPPMSGSVEEVWFDEHGDTTWVMFERDDGTSWAGVFGNGYVLKRRATGAAALSDERTVVVMARGRAYVLDAVDRKIICVLPGDTWSSVCAVPDRAIAIIAEFTTISAINFTGEIWRSDRVASDGIILDQATQQELVGKIWCWDGGWYAFSLRFEGWVIQKGDLLTPDWSAFEDPSG